MGKYRALFLLLICMSLSIIFLLIFSHKERLFEQNLQRFTFQSFQMGSMFTIVLYAENDSVANQASFVAFEEIEALNRILSDYLENSELNLLSQSSGSNKAVKVSDELFEILKESIRISELTDGLFDISAGPLTQSWRTIRSMPEPEIPTETELINLTERTGYQNIRLDEEKKTVELLKTGMQLDMGGIAKGYAADAALRVLKQFGINSALADAGGDISVSDAPPGREYWETVLPGNQPENETTHIILALNNMTAATSGDRYQYIEIDGLRYSHIINPKTGVGATGQIQATVIAEKGAHADALSTALTLMDPKKGMELINSLKKTEAIIFFQTDEGHREWRSEGFSTILK
jgi:FAD:protein FMN transferase